jgi:UDPglucose 6-dehydrogenase
VKIAVIGTGYVGLVTGTCLADSGQFVTCVDKDAAKIDTLRGGGIPIYEPGLEELVRRNVKDGRLAFSTALAETVGAAEVVFIAVGTPPDESGEADLSHVLGAAKEIGRALSKYCVVVTKSTVPVGASDLVAARIREVTKVPFDVVSNPEFLKEGSAVDDFMRPDRVVVGTTSEKAKAIMADLYAPFVRTEHPILYMDTRSSELTKYAANAMLATRISFMNDMAALCERTGADVDQVRRGMGADKRIGYPFLFPGVGYGGSCFPKDVRALAGMGRKVGLELGLLVSVERVNDRQKRLLYDKALAHFGSLSDKRFGLWGLSFKPKTDDVREAPALALAELLLAAGATVKVHDPVAAAAARRVLGDRVTYAEEPYGAAEGADALFLVTEWNEFRRPDFERLKRIMKTPVLLDGRNVWEPAKARAAGFTYFGVGRGAA